MLRVTLRDLQWRRRRFVIAIVGTSLVFAMTLVLTGLSNGFRVEANDTVDALGFDAYLVRSGPAGPFIGSPPFPEAEVAMVARIPGVTAAAPLVLHDDHRPGRRLDTECERVRRARTGPGNARDRDGPQHRRAPTRPRSPARSEATSATSSKSARAQCESSASSTTPPLSPGNPTCS